MSASIVTSLSSVAQQANYEKSVFAKTSRTNARGEGEQLGWQLWLACPLPGVHAVPVIVDTMLLKLLPLLRLPEL